ncbi:MAG: long-chain fatty acid--CoA ligase [Chlamydiae bacterium]|nr:long-chain fatty acid--CoA ligase [Chlamydiota bacterium]MBI3265489.1 long-chain fatty acid--CoA ligase [Chlamydiota bacterium]
MSLSTKKLDCLILDFMEEAQANEKKFNSLALELFKYQYLHNRPFQKYCLQLGRIPCKISHWKEIPFVPTTVFKEEILCCFPFRKAQKVFHTSGTTLQKKGRHYLENLRFYEKSLLIHFKNSFCIHEKRWPLLILTPTPQEMPHSSLCHMMGVLEKEIGIKGKTYYFLKKGKLLSEFLQKKLESFSSSDQPVIILGTAFSFVHFLDHCVEKKWKFKLPSGSRVMETGGTKGKSRELAKKELYEMIHQILDIPLTHIVNEYGMTEMGSQFYDNTLQNFIQKRKRKIYKNIPPWVRTRVLNPSTLEEQPKGKIGLLQHYDLANRSSVMGLLTEDMGVKMGDGFEILGRAPRAEPRGCSLVMQNYLT